MPHRRAVTSRQVRRRVWVADREGANLPYSKGLMATSIMATGLPPGRAYDLAELIEHNLLTSVRDDIDAESLSGIAADVLLRHEGDAVARRYLAWRAAKRSPRPIVVLIGGATGVGKSTVATRLAARLGITRVIPTDTVRELMRTFMPAVQAPELHGSSFEVGGGSERLIDGFLHQSRSVATGIDGMVGRMIAEHKDVIVEGIHLVPGMLDEAMLHRFRLEAAVVKVLLTLSDASVHRAHFIGRLESEHGRRPERYLRNLGDIRRIQTHLEELAGFHGFSLVEASDLDQAIQQVLDLVVAEVTSITGESQVVVAG
jgi:2-phosphoglycerate kinase